LKHKSEDYKISAVEYYLIEDKSQQEVCKIFKCLKIYKIEFPKKMFEEYYPKLKQNMACIRFLCAIAITILTYLMFIIITTMLWMNYQMILKQTEDRLHKYIGDAKQEILSNCEFESASEFTLYAGY
jgi:hypothetical protein